MIQTNERDSTTRIEESPRRETLRGRKIEMENKYLQSLQLFKLQNLEVHGKDMIIYPNPTEDVLYFKNSTEGTSIVEIFDIAGKRILTTHLGGDQVIKSLNVKGLTKGIYNYRFRTKEGGIFCGKFIKE